MIDKEKKPTLLIMAAGMGSRYGGLKQIDPVGSHGEIILDFSLYDAMMAGFVRAFLDDLPIDRAAKLALACSSIAVSCEQTINPALSLQAARALAFGQGAQENQITVS